MPDISRNTSQNALNEGYSRVLMQQGRVQLDADWNEQAELTHYRDRTITRDAFGARGVPKENAGFEIGPAGPGGQPVGGDFRIGPGRLYVDGLLVKTDRPWTYRNQPFFPDPPSPEDVLTPQNQNENGLVFVEIFEREVDAHEDGLLRERALGGADTTTRVQTAWRVGIMRLPGGLTPDDVIATVRQKKEALPVPEWQTTTGGLEAQVLDPSEVPDLDRPCLLAPEAGYLAQENQLYRVEVHRGGVVGGDPGTAPTFKWSRDNGSVVAPVTVTGDNELTFADDPRVNEGDFPAGTWAELIEGASGGPGRRGHLAQVRITSEHTIVLEPPPPQGLTDLQNPRLRRWDQQGPSPTLDDGVPVTGGWDNLEAGIQVRFAPGTYRTGEYWAITARTATGTIEWPPVRQQPDDPKSVRPFGGDIHFCPLALVSRARLIEGVTGTNDVTDLRLQFPTLSDLRVEQASTEQIITVTPRLLPVQSESAQTRRGEWMNRPGFAFAPLSRDAEGLMSIPFPPGDRIQTVRIIGRNQSIARITLSLLRHELRGEAETPFETVTIQRGSNDPTEFTQTFFPDLLIEPERFRYTFYALVDRPSGGGAFRPEVWLFALQITCTTD